MSQLRLKVFTPSGLKYDDMVDMVQIHGSNSFLGILPNHAPLISDVIQNKIIIRVNGEDFFCCSGDGVVTVDNNMVKVIVSFFEKAEDIDLDRALASKERAEGRLLTHTNEVDIKRAEASLSRALLRIEVAGTVIKWFI